MEALSIAFFHNVLRSNMIGFKKREVVYRPFETVFKIITDIVMIICLTYLLVIAFLIK